MFLDTSATQYAKTAVYDLTNVGQGHISGQYSTFTPAVPEPATYGMLLAGLAAAGMAARRRRG